MLITGYHTITPGFGRQGKPTWPPESHLDGAWLTCLPHSRRNNNRDLAAQVSIVTLWVPFTRLTIVLLGTCWTLSPSSRLTYRRRRFHFHFHFHFPRLHFHHHHHLHLHILVHLEFFEVSPLHPLTLQRPSSKISFAGEASLKFILLLVRTMSSWRELIANGNTEHRNIFSSIMCRCYCL